MLVAALWAGLAAASLLLGALIAQRWTVPTAVVGATMGFGAGALIAALAYDLIPDRNLADWEIWLSFGMGSVVFFALDTILERGDSSSAGIGIALGALLDGVPESIVLGVGLAVGGSISVGFLIAVLVSNIPEALSSTVGLARTHRAAWIYRIWASIVIVSAFAAALGYWLAKTVPGVDGRYIQALAAGAVLTMLAASTMPEAFDQGGRHIALTTALGFAVAALLTTVE